MLNEIYTLRKKLHTSFTILFFSEIMWKFCHHLLTLMLFQICLTFFYYVEYENKCRKSVGTKCCFGPRWDSLDWQKQLKYIIQNISVPLKTENSYRFGATWGWVNYCRFFYLGSFGTEQLCGAYVKACGLLYLTAVIERRCALANCRSAEAVLIERGKVCVCMCVEMSKRKSEWERELDGNLTGTSRGKQL